MENPQSPVTCLPSLNLYQPTAVFPVLKQHSWWALKLPLVEVSSHFPAIFIQSPYRVPRFDLSNNCKVLLHNSNNLGLC